MSARVRAPVTDLDEGVRLLAPEAGHYLGRVLRLVVGDTFVAFDPSAAREADAWIEQIDESTCVINVGPLRGAAIVAERSITWVQGLAKGDKCDAIVRDATELGATTILVATCARSVVRLDAEKAGARRDRWVRIAREAARQSGRGDAPGVDVCSWGEAMTRANGSARFCLDEQAEALLGTPLLAALATEGSLAFAAGPEGGLDESEITDAILAGWTVTSLGKIILRTETAAAAVLGAVRVWGTLSPVAQCCREGEIR